MIYVGSNVVGMPLGAMAGISARWRRGLSWLFFVSPIGHVIMYIAQQYGSHSWIPALVIGVLFEGLASGFTYIVLFQVGGAFITFESQLLEELSDENR
jgi:hypothetical protein